MAERSKIAPNFGRPRANEQVTGSEMDRKVLWIVVQAIERRPPNNKERQVQDRAPKWLEQDILHSTRMCEMKAP